MAGVRLLPGFLILVSIAGAVVLPHAAAAASETEGRRILLPYIRALTDCIANNIRINAGSLQKAHDGNWKGAVSDVIEYCDGNGAEMFTVHDRLFGRGTGKVFFKGPYLADLPRALSVRLKSDFNQLNIAAQDDQRRQAEKSQREAAASDAKKKLVMETVEQHENCLVSAIIDIAPYSTENAPTIVDVALDRCSKFTERRISIGVAAYDMTRDEASAIVSRKLAEIRTKLISVVVTARAEATKKRTEPDQGPAITSQSLPKAQQL